MTMTLPKVFLVAVPALPAVAAVAITVARPVFGSSAVARHLAFVAGAVSACCATSVMLARSDVKGALAWSTAGQMGA